MAWTAPKTWTVDSVLTAADMNTHVRDNLNYLLNPNKAVVIRNNSGDYTTTSTSWVDIDSTNLKITLTTYGGPVLVHFSAFQETGLAEAFYDLDVDGTRVGAAFTDGLTGNKTGSGWAQYASHFTYLVTGLAAGSHTFKVKWKNNSGPTYTVTLRSNSTENPIQFWAIEL